MKLEVVYARFYKSFNFDHIRKAHPDAKKHPWEMYADSDQFGTAVWRKPV